MKHNVAKILAILNDGLNREVNALNQFWEDENHEYQENIIEGIELAISWIENNITTK